MADKINVEKRSANMRAIRSKDMAPEIGIRKLIHGMGLRFRLHRKDLPGKPDLVFPNLKKVIFVHGCFWHQHKRPGCKDGRVPKSRLEYWGPKLERNKRRDHENQKNLKKMGWESLVVWECETRDNDKITKRVVGFLSKRERERR